MPEITVGDHYKTYTGFTIVILCVTDYNISYRYIDNKISTGNYTVNRTYFIKHIAMLWTKTEKPSNKKPRVREQFFI